MPRLTIWTLRCAMLHLALGAAIGGLLLAAKGLGVLPAIWQLRTLHIHMMLLGWTAQAAWGVAFWIMPRLSGANDRGSQPLAWLATAALNLGAAAIALDALLGWLGRPAAVAPALAAAAAYVVAGVAMTLQLWPRTRPPQPAAGPAPAAGRGG